MPQVPDLEFELNQTDWAVIGDAFFQQRMYDKSAGCYGRAITVPPTDPDILTKYGASKLKIGDTASAEWAVDEAFQLNAESPYAYHVAAMLAEQLNRFDAAEEAFKKAISILPAEESFHVNLAHLYQVIGDYANSEAEYAMVMTLNPTNLESRFYRSMTILTQGRFEEGYREYELRYALYKPPVPHNGKPVWRGVEGIAGKTVLICAEQGIGDAVHFARYAQWLKTERGAAKVIAMTMPAIMKLIAAVSGVDEVIEEKYLKDCEYDFHIPMMSLPGLSLDNGQPWYGECPYLNIPRDQHWMNVMGSSQVKVGFCWRGNIQHGNNRFRSIDGALFKPLCEMNIWPVSLQHDMPPAHEAMYDAHPAGVYDLAQAIRELDLVITVDTATAHLAGALGVECWMLVPSNPDFRWGLGSESTPWYPSLKLFRAQKPLEWQPVIDRIASELRRRIS